MNWVRYAKRNNLNACVYWQRLCQPIYGGNANALTQDSEGKITELKEPFAQLGVRWSPPSNLHDKFE